MEITFEINKAQVKEIDNLLKTLPKTLQSKIMRSALKSASKPLRDEIKKNIPDFGNLKHFTLLDKKTQKKVDKEADSATLKRSIGAIIRRGKNDRQLYAVVGPILDRGGFFGKWIEFGTLAKRTKPLVKGRSNKAQAAADKGLGLKKMPFMRPAIKKAGPSVIKTLRFLILKGIEEQTAKSIKRGKI
ncbi:MAG: HK97 gp10 family phage protein [Flavobacteriales bacterium]|nr:HK97 gp10 family phage protein [Flavobacteriales bacterium]